MTLSSLLLWATIAMAQVQADKGGPEYIITVEITNLRSNQGYAHLALYDSEDAYMKDPCQSASVTIGSDNKAIAHFDKVSPGTFAVTVFHDVNENNELDTNLIGIPKEDYGFSQNARGIFGPAKFHDASFKISSKDVKLVISMTSK